MAATETKLEPPKAGRGQPARIEAAQLFGGHREVILEHDGQEYRLRLTSNGKLILTK
ncbi:MAG TPA: hemin uptake protein HemP [Rhizomicrobium sp.]|nr:hemin uptake protein HemP [Rhizomicrobium sp.]HWC63073.1 hemin uptake protein HemP [Rhizomicrobium sp.]